MISSLKRKRGINSQFLEFGQSLDGFGEHLQVVEVQVSRIGDTGRRRMSELLLWYFVTPLIQSSFYCFYYYSQTNYSWHRYEIIYIYTI